MKLGSGMNYSSLSKTELSPVFHVHVVQKKVIFRVKSIFISFGGKLTHQERILLGV